MKLLRSKVAEVTPEEEEGEQGLPESLGARGRRRLQLRLRDDAESCCSQDENPLENS